MPIHRAPLLLRSDVLQFCIPDLQKKMRNKIDLGPKKYPNNYAPVEDDNEAPLCPLNPLGGFTPQYNGRVGVALIKPD